MDLKDVKFTYKLTTDTSTSCPYCTEWQEGDDLDLNINHLLLAHEGTILYVGGEAKMDDSNRPYHNTTALVGFGAIPNPKPANKFQFDIKLTDK